VIQAWTIVTPGSSTSSSYLQEKASTFLSGCQPVIRFHHKMCFSVLYIIPSQYVRTALFWEQLTFLTNADEIRSQRNFEPWPNQRQSVSCPPCHRHLFGKRNMCPSSPALTSQLFANARATILELTSIYIAEEITQHQYTSRREH